MLGNFISRIFSHASLNKNKMCFGVKMFSLTTSKAQLAENNIELWEGVTVFKISTNIIKHINEGLVMVLISLWVQIWYEIILIRGSCIFFYRQWQKLSSTTSFAADVRAIHWSNSAHAMEGCYLGDRSPGTKHLSLYAVSIKPERKARYQVQAW